MTSRHRLHISPFALLAAWALVGCEVSQVGEQPLDAGYDDTDSSITETQCDGSAVGQVERRTRFQSEQVRGDATCLAQEQTRTCEASGSWSAWSGDYAAESCQVEGYQSCANQPHGSTVTRERFQAATVPHGSTCVAETQQRACDDGTWSASSGSFAYDRCQVDGAASCGDSPHGTAEERTRYEAAEVPFGSTCRAEQQTRSCSESTWSEWTGNFTSENCRVIGALSCGNSPHGTVEERTRFEQGLVERGQTCRGEAQTRSCTNGAWSAWSGSFAAELCDVDGARRCGATLHGQSIERVRFQNAEVPYGTTCVSEPQTSTCSDGSFEPWTGSYTADVCSVALPQGCDEQAHGAQRERTRFQAAEVPYGATCVSQVQTSTCENGTWSEFSGDFAATACDVGEPAACEDGAHGDVRTRVRFQATQVPYGSECVAQTQESTCQNGSWSAYGGSFTAEDCDVALPADCDGQPHGSTRTRTQYAAASVAAGAACVGELQTSTCSNGSWGAYSGTYSQPTCRLRGRDCTDFLMNSTVQDGDAQSRTAYAEAFPSGSCNAEVQQRTCTNGAFGAWSGSHQLPGCASLSTRTNGAVSCRMTTSNVPICSQWTGVDPGSISCPGGELDATHGCPAGGSVSGICSVSGGGVTSKSFYYNDVPASIRSGCEQAGGTWTTP